MRRDPVLSFVATNDLETSHCPDGADEEERREVRNRVKQRTSSKARYCMYDLCVQIDFLLDLEH